MATTDQLRILAQGVSIWNVWRREHPKSIIAFTEADFLELSSLAKTAHSGLMLSGVDFRGVILRGVSLRGADLSCADLSCADLGRADLKGIALHGANLTMASLSWADLTGADLSETNLRGTHLWGVDFREANLSGADLCEVDLRGVDLRETNLSRANLGGIDLARKDLRGTNLRGANLSQANLSGQDLSGQDLSEANFSEANLSGVNFIRALLSGTDFSQANLIKASFNGAVLSNACLWETQRAGWSIQGVICEAVYWDKDKKERTEYKLGEFERFFADKTKIVLHYEGGISPIEIATLPALIQRIEATHPDCVLRLQSIQDAPGGATVTLMIEDGSARDPDQLRTLKAAMETAAQEVLHYQRAWLQETGRREQIENMYYRLFPQMIGHASGASISIRDSTIQGNIVGHLSGSVAEVQYGKPPAAADTKA